MADTGLGALAERRECLFLSAGRMFSAGRSTHLRFGMSDDTNTSQSLGHELHFLNKTWKMIILIVVMLILVRRTAAITITASRSQNPLPFRSQSLRSRAAGSQRQPADQDQAAWYTVGIPGLNWALTPCRLAPLQTLRAATLTAF